jgi:hypothetical protein
MAQAPLRVTGPDLEQASDQLYLVNWTGTNWQALTEKPLPDGDKGSLKP